MTTRTVALGPAFATLRDDDEETLVGGPLHQEAINALYNGLGCGPRRGLPWFIGNQLKIVIPRTGNRAPYQPAPDILVHPTLTAASRSSLILAVDGPPVLVIEVASPATALERDVNLAAPTGKPRVYEAIGVGEYLVFDPAGDILGTQVWARRAGPHGYTPWEPDADGRWVSTELGIAFQPQGVLLRVYDQEGRLVPTVEELASRAETAAALADRVAALEAELRRLRDA